MLAKEMKYEAIATGRMLLPLSGAVIVINCIIKLILFIFIKSQFDSPLVEFISGGLMTIFVMSIIVLVVATQILVIYRYYRSMGSDEAYLTFSLPMNNSLHIWSRLIVSTIFCFLSIVISLICTFIVSPEVLDEIKLGLDIYLLNSTLFHSYFSLVVVLCIFFIISAAISNLQYFAAISFGVSSSSPVLMSVVAYMAINFVVSIIVAILSIPFFIKFFSLTDIDFNFERLVLLYLSVITLISGVIFYTITWYRTEKKLNVH